jgi:hypothetical protein
MEARTQKGKQYKQNQLEKSTKGKKRMSCFTSFQWQIEDGLQWPWLLMHLCPNKL